MKNSIIYFLFGIIAAYLLQFSLNFYKERYVTCPELKFKNIRKGYPHIVSVENYITPCNGRYSWKEIIKKFYESCDTDEEKSECIIFCHNFNNPHDDPSEFVYDKIFYYCPDSASKIFSIHQGENVIESEY